MATVDSTHLKFIQQADLDTQMQDLEYRNDTKMDLINNNTEKQVRQVPESADSRNVLIYQNYWHPRKFY